MQKWEYSFVFATVTDDGEFRPRFANEEELDDWQAGPTMYEYANQLGGAWLGTACQQSGRLHPIQVATLRETQFIASELRAITMVFKRPKKGDSDVPC